MGLQTVDALEYPFKLIVIFPWVFGERYAREAFIKNPWENDNVEKAWECSTISKNAFKKTLQGCTISIKMLFHVSR